MIIGQHHQYNKIISTTTSITWQASPSTKSSTTKSSFTHSGHLLPSRGNRASKQRRGRSAPTTEPRMEEAGKGVRVEDELELLEVGGEDELEGRSRPAGWR